MSPPRSITTHDRSPDLRFVLQATADIRNHLSAGQVVVIESTKYPERSDMSIASSNFAQEISNRMPAYVAARVQNMLNEAGKPGKGSRILLLGGAYRRTSRKTAKHLLAQWSVRCAAWGPRSLRTTLT